MKLADLIARLDQDLDAIGESALAKAADNLARLVQADLSTLPGGLHDHPWLQTGTLHDSVSAEACGPVAVVGSTDPVALHQEQGTITVPPRPSFVPRAIAEAESIAHAIAQAVANALRGA